MDCATYQRNNSCQCTGIWDGQGKGYENLWQAKQGHTWPTTPTLETLMRMHLILLNRHPQAHPRLRIRIVLECCPVLLRDTFAFGGIRVDGLHFRAVH